jgi:hypothetical protein
MKKNNTLVMMDIYDARRLEEALEDAKCELETIEAQIDWYSCFKVCDKIETSIEQLKMAMAAAGYDA